MLPARKYLKIEAFVWRWRSARESGSAGARESGGGASAMGRRVSARERGRVKETDLLLECRHGRGVRKSAVRACAGRCPRDRDLGLVHALRRGQVPQDPELREPDARRGGGTRRRARALRPGGRGAGGVRRRRARASRARADSGGRHGRQGRTDDPPLPLARPARRPDAGPHGAPGPCRDARALEGRPQGGRHRRRRVCPARPGSSRRACRPARSRAPTRPWTSS